MEIGKFYERKEDMSPDGVLTLLMEGDGDIILQVWAYDGGMATRSRAQVEFCNLTNGGGRSLHTRRALIALADAIKRDNAERPI